MLSADDRKVLETYGRRTVFRKRRVLFHEGDPAGAVFLLLEGRVRVEVLTPGGRRVLLAIKQAGELVGELAAIVGGDRSASATVMDDVEAVVVPAPRFRSFVAEYPSAAVHVMEQMAFDLQAVGADHVVRTEGSVTERLAARLHSLALQAIEHDGDAVVIPLGLGHEELASWISASREAVSRSMAELRRTGAIESRRGRITVQDIDLLAAHASPSSV